MPLPSGKPAAPGSTFASQHDAWQPRPFGRPLATAAAAPAGPAMSEWSKAAQAETTKKAAAQPGGHLGGPGAATGGRVFARPTVLPNGAPGAPPSAEFGGVVSMPAPPPIPVPVAAPVAATGVSAPGLQMDGPTPQVFPPPGTPGIAPGLLPPKPVSTKSFWDDLYAKHPGAGAQPTKPTKTKGRPRL